MDKGGKVGGGRVYSRRATRMFSMVNSRFHWDTRWSLEISTYVDWS